MEANNSSKLEVSKTVKVPVEILFKAWNDPEQLKQWWKPMGNHLKEVTNDLAVGGTVRYIFNENTLIISGNYEEVKENERLVYSWNWDFPQDAVKNAAYKLTVLFSAEGDSSTIRVQQENNQGEETLHVNEDGWNKGLDDLAAFLENGGQQSDRAVHGAGGEDAGYRESPDQLKVGGG